MSTRRGAWGGWGGGEEERTWPPRRAAPPPTAPQPGLGFGRVCDREGLSPVSCWTSPGPLAGCARLRRPRAAVTNRSGERARGAVAAVGGSDGRDLRCGVAAAAAVGKGRLRTRGARPVSRHPLWPPLIDGAVLGVSAALGSPPVAAPLLAGAPGGRRRPPRWPWRCLWRRSHVQSAHCWRFDPPLPTDAGPRGSCSSRRSCRCGRHRPRHAAMVGGEQGGVDFSVNKNIINALWRERSAGGGRGASGQSKSRAGGSPSLRADCGRHSGIRRARHSGRRRTCGGGARGGASRSQRHAASRFVFSVFPIHVRCCRLFFFSPPVFVAVRQAVGPGRRPLG